MLKRIHLFIVILTVFPVAADPGTPKPNTGTLLSLMGDSYEGLSLGMTETKFHTLDLRAVKDDFPSRGSGEYWTIDLPDHPHFDWAGFQFKNRRLEQVLLGRALESSEIESERREFLHWVSRKVSGVPSGVAVDEVWREPGYRAPILYWTRPEETLVLSYTPSSVEGELLKSQEHLPIFFQFFVSAEGWEELENDIEAKAVSGEDERLFADWIEAGADLPMERSEAC